MLTGHPAKIVVLLAASGLLSGCAQPGPFSGYRLSMGTLKASVSHLEQENGQLRQQVDKLQSENREIENRLVQEESVNGDLAARLDDAKDLLRRRGLESDQARASNSPREREAPSDPGPARPAGQTLRKRRKPPSVQIPGQIDTTPPAADDEEQDRTAPARDPYGPQSRFDDPNRWLPVARGVIEPSPTRTR